MKPNPELTRIVVTDRISAVPRSPPWPAELPFELSISRPDADPFIPEVHHGQLAALRHGHPDDIIHLSGPLAVSSDPLNELAVRVKLPDAAPHLGDVDFCGRPDGERRYFTEGVFFRSINGADTKELPKLRRRRLRFLSTIGSAPSSRDARCNGDPEEN